MTEVYTPGELQLIYDLVNEFPTRLNVETLASNPGKLKLHVKDAELLGFIDYLVNRLRVSRNYLNNTVVIPSVYSDSVPEPDYMYGYDADVH
jgi:hypothetical protein